jgi:hypothetical protein
MGALNMARLLLMTFSPHRMDVSMRWVVILVSTALNHQNREPKWLQKLFIPVPPQPSDSRSCRITRNVFS